MNRVPGIRSSSRLVSRIIGVSSFSRFRASARYRSRLAVPLVEAAGRVQLPAEARKVRVGFALVHQWRHRDQIVDNVGSAARPRLDVVDLGGQLPEGRVAHVHSPVCGCQGNCSGSTFASSIIAAGSNTRWPLYLQMNPSRTNTAMRLESGTEPMTRGTGWNGSFSRRMAAAAPSSSAATAAHTSARTVAPSILSRLMMPPPAGIRRAAERDCGGLSTRIHDAPRSGRNSWPDAVSRADVEVARYPASARDHGPFGRPAAVRAHVTDLEAKLDEKT